MKYRSEESARDGEQGSEGDMITIDNILDLVEIAIADPESPMYGSDCVPWMEDICRHVREQSAEMQVYKDELVDAMYESAGLRQELHDIKHGDDNALLCPICNSVTSTN